MLPSYVSSRQEGLTLAAQGYTEDLASQSVDSDSKWSRTQADSRNENRNLAASSAGPLVPPCPLQLHIHVHSHIF